jgi:hypothetical protein
MWSLFKKNTVFTDIHPPWIFSVRAVLKFDHIDHKSLKAPS